MKRIVVFTGAGTSAESGLKTFRDSGGLWEEHDVYRVATPEAWEADPALVLEFYNMRRHQVASAQPNAAHRALCELEKAYDVQIITQNIDDLHERSGSKNVLHLHGEIFKARSTADESLLYEVKGSLKLGDTCEKGSQLRPHVVWFGEAVPLFAHASSIMQTADIVMIIGTSLNVYPAANLIYHTQPGTPIYLIDPAEMEHPVIPHLHVIKERASVAVPALVVRLLEQAPAGRPSQAKQP